MSMRETETVSAEDGNSSPDCEAAILIQSMWLTTLYRKLLSMCEKDESSIPRMHRTTKGY